MNSGVSSSLFVSSLGGTVNSQSVPAYEDSLLEARFSRVPLRVLFDTRLKRLDVVVYALLSAYSKNGPRIRAGLRWIAKSAHASKDSVSKSLSRLEAAGHVRSTPERGKIRGEYRLTSAVFEYKGQGEAPVQAAPRTMTECPGCHKERIMTRSGCCRACLGRHKTEAAIEQVMLAQPGISRKDAYAEIRSGAKTFRESFKNVRRRLKDAV